MNENELIEKSWEYKLRKSNQITFGSRYNYTVDEQKTITYICSLIDTTSEKPELEYIFDIRDFCRSCGIDYKNGKVYEYVRNILKGLVQKVMILESSEGKRTTVNWIQKVWADKCTGKAKIRLDEDMIPYLFELKTYYADCKLNEILCMKSRFSIRLYEILKDYYDLNTEQTDHKKSRFPKIISWTIDVDELKKKLRVENIPSYSQFGLFRTKVLEPAHKEINAFTEIIVFFEPISTGRKITHVKFGIVSKDMVEKFKSATKAEEKAGLSGK